MVLDVKRHETRSTLRGVYPDGGTSSASCAMISSVSGSSAFPDTDTRSTRSHLVFPQAVSRAVLRRARMFWQHRGRWVLHTWAVPSPSRRAQRSPSSRPYSSCSSALEVLAVSISEPAHSDSNNCTRPSRLGCLPDHQTQVAERWHCSRIQEKIGQCLTS